MKITEFSCNFVREPLIKPFGFKGGQLSELWNTIVKFKSESGQSGLGLGLQSVLWSDSQVFADWPEASGNAAMFQISCFGAKLAVGLEWNTPEELLDQILPKCYEYGKQITNNPDLRLTFALNALVPVDNAAWQLYAESINAKTFSDLLPNDYKSLDKHHSKLAAVPLISYGVNETEIKELLDEGYYVLKIKIGSDPDGDGDLDKMVKWDCERFGQIHKIASEYTIENTESGKVLYYLDANGRYDTKERLNKFLDYSEKIGAMESVIILEEPFPEECLMDVSDINAPITADESAHSDEHALERIELGYKIIALKPIAKTMSMSLKVARLAKEKGAKCFCADLTVNPVMVEWNKCVAAILDPLDGLETGVLESNGAQNFKNWETMLSYHPCNGKDWVSASKGAFSLDEDFYNCAGGIFTQPAYYNNKVEF